MNLKKIYPNIFLLLYLPIFFINNIWDGSIIKYGFYSQEILGIKNWYFESSSNFQFYVINILFNLNKFLNLKNELIFDFFTVVILFLFCQEVKKYFNRVFYYDKKYNNLCYILVLTFPVWSFLTETNLSLYLFCFYLAILGVRLISNKNNIVNLLGYLFIMFSFSIKSNFSFVLALSFLETFHNALFKQKKSYKNFFIVFVICTLGFFINSYYFPPYGLYEGYNQLNYKDIKIFSFINILDYLSFILYYFFIPAILLIYLKFQKVNKKKIIFLNNENKKRYLLLFIFSILCLGPYYLVQKSTDIFNFSGFESRHVFSFSIIISFSLALFLRSVENKFSKKFLKFFTIFLILQNIFILSVSFFVKYNSTLINKNLIKNFTEIDEPKSGYVLISNEKIDRNFYNTNFILFSAYGKSNWMSKLVKNERLDKNKIELMSHFNEESNFMKNKEYKIKYISKDFVNKCLTIFKITREISGFDLIRKFYIFNQEKYFKINKVDEKC